MEDTLWLDGPQPHGVVNQFLTIALIPLALLAQAWGPLFGSTFDRPIRGRRLTFFVLLILGLTFVVIYSFMVPNRPPAEKPGDNRGDVDV
ncbi:hypothetical protein [Roseimaritima ulvae]|uniref:Uncharacterized protein n=1 Tax=Roseimaritima ulvae TaxID=980254 RepID=A0A5B9R011_9BACT|nr:hypothetical protein [Roseimaritima ulvae]QEG39603.1 hypothetical protein UC8_15990 [Roseimaritima ulvae]